MAVSPPKYLIPTLSWHPLLHIGDKMFRYHALISASHKAAAATATRYFKFWTHPTKVRVSPCLMSALDQSLVVLWSTQYPLYKSSQLFTAAAVRSFLKFVTLLNFSSAVQESQSSPHNNQFRCSVRWFYGTELDESFKIGKTFIADMLQVTTFGSNCKCIIWLRTLVTEHPTSPSCSHDNTRWRGSHCTGGTT